MLQEHAQTCAGQDPGENLKGRNAAPDGLVSEGEGAGSTGEHTPYLHLTDRAVQFPESTTRSHQTISLLMSSHFQGKEAAI
jgi:hypothetical protein